MTPTRLQIGTATAGLAVALAAFGSVYACHLQGCAQPVRLSVADALLWAFGGLSYLGVGLVVWMRRPDHRIGLLFVVVGLAWFAFPDDEFVRSSLARTTSLGTTYFLLVRDLWIPVLIALAAAFPAGRLRRCDQWMIGGLAAFYLARNLAVMLFWHPSFELWGPVANLLLVRPDPVVVSRIEAVGFAIDEPVLLALVGWIVWRWWRASLPLRRAMAPLLWAALPWVVSFALGTARLAGAGDTLRAAENFFGRVGLLALPFGLLALLLHHWLAHDRLGRLLDDLATPTPASGLQPRLAAAIGDPSLTIALPQPDGTGYVGADGQPIRFADAPPDRGITYVEGDRGPVAALLHDPALTNEPELLAAAVSTVRLALDTARLHATIRAQLDEVRASRARIVEAADAERRRLERDLHDGAQQRLVTLGIALQMARQRLGTGGDPTVGGLLDRANEEVAQAIGELRELARGIRPAILDEGLASAVEDLADRLSIAVDTDITAARLPAEIETTAYFVIAEALTNVAKHASAAHATVAATHDGDHLVIEVTDDGVGGADPGGAGLVGLADRVAAAGGHLLVSTGPCGTRLTAHLPATAVDDRAERR